MSSESIMLIIGACAIIPAMLITMMLACKLKQPIIMAAGSIAALGLLCLIGAAHQAWLPASLSFVTSKHLWLGLSGCIFYTWILMFVRMIATKPEVWPQYPPHVQPYAWFVGGGSAFMMALTFAAYMAAQCPNWPATDWLAILGNAFIGTVIGGVLGPCVDSPCSQFSVDQNPES